MSVYNLLKMRIEDFGENADGGKWTFRWGNLTWGKMSDHQQSTLSDLKKTNLNSQFLSPIKL